MSEGLRAQFERDGYVLVQGVFSKTEAKDLRAEGHGIIERLSSRYDTNGTWSTAAEAGALGGSSLQHCHDVQFHSAKFSRMLTDPRLVDVAAEVMDSPNVELHHNKLFVKPPANGSPFPMHQDWPFFPHANDSVIAAVVHLDDAGEEQGCFKVMPGSHRLGRIPHVGDRHWHLPTDEFPLGTALAVPAKAGDVLVFGCLTVHGSGVNVSDRPRTTWLLQLRDPADEPTVDRHRSPGQGTMLRGRNEARPLPPTVL
ncbi:UNVERIFIED_CONTAM: hypothetical protein GTU68_001918 [Idotea baltica]|nr:hypothetical protein [Idotea baltica]